MVTSAREAFRQDWGLTTCAFCGGQGPLLLSHIVPRFVLAWIKRTSGTGHVRSSTDPNRRTQDSWKVRLLCRNCEQQFGEWERRFSADVFKPIHASTTSNIEYGPWFSLFAASLCWRILKMYSMIDEYGGNFPRAFVPAASRALTVWQHFINGDVANPGRCELHALRLDLIMNHTVPNLPSNINRYLYRALDVDLPANRKSAFVYAKLARVLIIGHIIMPTGREWFGTRISPSEGRFGLADVRVPGLLANFMAAKASRLQALQDEISPRQREIANAAMMEDLDRLANSEVFLAMQRDVDIFGRAAFQAENTGTKDAGSQNNDAGGQNQD